VIPSFAYLRRASLWALSIMAFIGAFCLFMSGIFALLWWVSGGGALFWALLACVMWIFLVLMFIGMDS
jgi:membrane protein required for beta-lactamase induction